MKKVIISIIGSAILIEFLHLIYGIKISPFFVLLFSLIIFIFWNILNNYNNRSKKS
ncbi:hypothetical protein FBBAL38_00530 [Flavobacteria bacterium BAL38]|nr:hypothetical protein FBBAL38_00530 [Flavobacteria bacterium BAL38]